VGECGYALHCEHERITRAQPHRARKVFDCDIRLATAERSDRSAGVPGNGQVRIERERARIERDGSLEIAGDITERQPAEGKGNRVILPQLGRQSGETGALGHFLHAIACPAVYLANDVAERRRAVGGGKVGIELDSLGKQVSASLVDSRVMRCALANPRRK